MKTNQKFEINFENKLMENVDKSIEYEVQRISELENRIIELKNKMKIMKKVNKEAYRRLMQEYLDLVKIL